GQRALSLFKNAESSLRLLRHLRGQVAGVVFGGYAGLPLGLACILRRKPLFLHEQNSVPSRSNALLSKFAKRIFITFERSRAYFPQDKVVKVGIPVRKSLLEGRHTSQEEARRALGLEEEFTLLVMGGSQGASFLNQLAMEVFLKTGWQGIHITGERDYQSLKSLYAEKKLRVLTLPFSHQMGKIYRASSVALSRAGASSIAELSLYGLPALFIPFPHAVGDHQFHNAEEIQEMGGGLLLRQELAQTSQVVSLLERIARERELFSRNISAFANPLACERMLEYILQEGG
ncbi:MAG: UDP-N-acetylglucosamine--N-acetylmuramyl-(pentapeptide) pyrophosphoryl-undecaprenol N-acetylglucosamine transferase, partial [Aquificaceae bacterium]|nr:UDP-N-acetylglucosamine--N-acetylmuramyl-(pentapeptide) pyrophosphoryl-undecaprenol N-acetylglucosamine transferase [Aquificaceae bacterium]